MKMGSHSKHKRSQSGRRSRMTKAAANAGGPNGVKMSQNETGRNKMKLGTK